MVENKMKKIALIMIIASAFFTVGNSAMAEDQSENYTNTVGKFGLGGKQFLISIPLTSLGLISGSTSTAASALTSYNTSFVSLRFGITQNLNLGGLVGLTLMNGNISGGASSGTSFNALSLAIGGQLDYIFARTDRMRTHLGAALVLNGLGGAGTTSGSSTTNIPIPTLIGLVPELGVEYFLTKNLSLEGSLALPLFFITGSQNGVSVTASFINIDFRPIVGAHYYF